MREYEIIDTNADNISGCSFCGYKNARDPGYCRKTDWLKESYAQGLRFKVLRSRESGDVGMIEYASGNHAWRPVEAAGYLVIHCLMVNHKHKGKGLGSLLLDSCLKDAKRSKCLGVAVVTSADSFMAKRDLFIKAGFVSADCIPPFEVLVKKFKKAAPDPHLIVDRERLIKRYSKGVTILAADQCPYAPKTAERIAEASRRLGFGNFVPGQTTIGSRPALTLDFDRKNDGGTWNCRHYFVAEGTLRYVLGFGTTRKTEMFEVYDRMAKSFEFQSE